MPFHSYDHRTVYLITDPRDFLTVYVGVTFDCYERFKDHLEEARRGKKHTRKNVWIKEMLDAGIDPLLEEIETVETKASWKQEKVWIQHYASMGMHVMNSPGTYRRETARKHCAENAYEKARAVFEAFRK